MQQKFTKFTKNDMHGTMMPKKQRFFYLLFKNFRPTIKIDYYYSVKDIYSYD